MGQRLHTLGTLLARITLIINIVLFPAGPAYAQESVTPQDLYRAEFISQNAHPYLTVGQSYQFSVTVKNVGGVSWDPDVVHLGTDRPQDRAPLFVREDINGGNPSGWFRENRVLMARDADGDLIGDANSNDFIDLNETATFRFWYSVPGHLADGTYREHFNVVADDVTWLNDLGIFWSVTVDNHPHARWVDQNPFPGTLKADQSYEFWVRFENTGLIAWRPNGATPVHLGTDRPMDRIPPFIREGPAGTESGWVRENRVRLDRDASGDLIGDVNHNEMIDSGEIARFRFWYTVPATMESGLYREYFRPVMDNRSQGWMEDFGLYWDIPVDNVAPRPASLTLTAQVNKLHVRWPAVPEATSYRVRYRPVGGDFTILNFPASITSTDIVVTGGQSFEVGVASIDAEGISPFTSKTIRVESLEERQARLAREEAARRAILGQVTPRPATPVAPPPAPEPEPPIVTGPPAEAEEPRDWRRFWLTLLILLGAAGLATAGYYGYEWWAESRRRPRPPRIEPPRREPPKQPSPPKPPAPPPPPPPPPRPPRARW